ncbi:hypothetical protein BFJ72_g12770 [Fusarium proliferatum]|uniref:Uncharacterized protein n=1 Tax=Gibberella intermedia TaxID=948311 RepID=A0A420SF17_GIBIN|nr:hypothetical protein BFJ72_g12770 [Fusarium proliferatum]
MSLTEGKIKSQKLGLFDLPNELLLSIIEVEDLQWMDHINIHHVSSRLFQLTFKHVYDGKRDIFEYACFTTNLDLIIECVKDRNVPTSQVWRDPDHGFYVTPLDLVTHAFEHGRCSADQYIKIAEWLFDNGYQTQQVECRDGEMITSHVVSPVLLTMLSTATDADDHRSICQVIEFLTNKGLEFPPPSSKLLRTEYKKTLEHPEYRVFAYDSGSDIEMMLQSACPPALLEFYLRNMLSNLGLTLKSRLAPGDRDDLLNIEWTALNDLVRILFDDLFAPWIYKGDSPSYFADTFEAKIKLLIKHGGIHGHEQSALENILETLRSIEARQRDNGSLDFERDGTWCWRELCLSICHYPRVRDHSLWPHCSLENPPRAIGPDVERCVHEFVRPKEWYPPQELAFARARHFEHARGKLDPSWLEDNTDKDWVNMPLDAWNFIRLKNGEPGMDTHWNYLSRGAYSAFLDETFDEDENESEADE